MTNKVIGTLSPEPLRCLVALSTFRFLTAKQMVRLGVAKSEPVVRNHVIERLSRHKVKPFIRSHKMGSFLPYIHYMTQYGAEKLAEVYKYPIEEFKYPIGRVQFSPMFAKHRFAQVDFHIGLRQWALWRGDINVLFSDMDFDGTGSRKGGNFVRQTSITLPDDPIPITPDGIFGIEVNGTPLLYALEVHRTTQTKFAAIQIQRYMSVLERGAIGYKYGIQASPFVCSVHTLPNVLKGVKSQLMKTPEFEAFYPAFVFNTAEQLDKDFSEGWHFADGKPANPFPKPEKAPLENMLELLSL